jgi:hypothetical protein
MISSDSLVKIAPALVKAQAETGAALKGSTNPFFKSKYADLGSVMEACKEPFNKAGITILQPIVGANVETILIHESGEYIGSQTPIMCKDPADPQKFGGAISYARRYGLQSMVLIPAEDDDGETAKKPAPTATRTAVPAATQAAVPAPTATASSQVPLDEDDPIDAAIAGSKCPACGATKTASGKIFHKPGCPRKVEAA